MESGDVGKMDPMDATAGDPLIQRCVIIQKDERGYGLAVSGDNPVFVRSVKEMVLQPGRGSSRETESSRSMVLL